MQTKTKKENLQSSARKTVFSSAVSGSRLADARRGLNFRDGNNMDCKGENFPQLRNWGRWRDSRPVRKSKLIQNIIIISVLLVVFSLMMVVWGYTEEIDVDQLATAIYHAENSKAHPYGIMVKYRHTTPRQACINTITHALRDWDGQGDFISFLQKRYAPIGVSNDPHGLNKNWIKNVKYFLAKSRGK